MEKLKIEYVKPKDLEVDAFNVRDDYTDDPELEESIKAQGIIEPLIVRKVPKKKKLQVVCGGRRRGAAIAVALPLVPIVVRKLTDLQALGLSLQENLQRGDLTSFEEAEAIAKMWDIMNGGKTAEAKLKMIHEQFGIKKAQTYRYLEISRLSDQLKQVFKKKTEEVSSKRQDTNTLAAISTEDSWDDEEKEEAFDVLANIPTQKERSEVLKDLKRAAKEGISPEEAYEEIKQRPEGRSYNFYLSYKTNKRFEAWCKRKQKDYKTALVEAVEEYIKRNK